MENIEQSQSPKSPPEIVSEMSSDQEVLTDEVEQLRSELEKTNQERSEFRDLAQRAQADFINYRRRADEEQKQSQMIGNSQLLSSLLPVIDDFDRAQDTIPHSKSKKDIAWLAGLSLVIKKLHTVLETAGVQIIKSEDEQLDPWIHEAVAYEEKTDIPEGRILNVIRQGYTLHGKVLRPTLVTVSKCPKLIEPDNSGVGINKEQSNQEKEA